MAKKKITRKKSKFAPLYRKINQIVAFKLNIADNITPHIDGLVSLSLRIWVGLIFWQSGVLKLQSWDSTLMLFELEYPVPYLSVDMAAYLETFNEITLPIMLFLGLGSRIAAFGLIISTLVMQFTYQNSHEHFIWFIVLLTILIRGSGIYSFDYFIRAEQIKTNRAMKKLSLIPLEPISRLIAIIIIGIMTLFSIHEALALISPSTEAWLDDILEYWQSIGSGQ